MIKAAGTLHGKPLLVLGLSATNCERLLANQPIKISAAQLGLPDMIVILLGGEPDEVHEDLRTIGVPHQAQDHQYLSTACLHAQDPGREDLHEYCQASTGHAGAKKPATCKFCAAPCECDCHQ